MKNAAPIRVADLCALLSVDVPDGLGDLRLTGVSTLEQAGEEDLSFVTRDKFHRDAENSRAGIILVPAGFKAAPPRFLEVPHVMGALLKVLEHFHPVPPAQSFIHPTAVVDGEARIGESVFVGPHVVVEKDAVVGARTRIEAGSFIGEGAQLGEDCWLSPNVTLLHHCLLGARVRIHPGTVIGADGFRYEMIGKRLAKIPQVGRVVIEEDVEIGANCTIDRAFLEDTQVGARTKLDNNVHVGHNVQIGSDCILVAQVGIAGSTKIGRGVQVGGAAVMKDHITVGDGARIGGRAAVQGNVAPGAQVIGTPAIDVRDYARFANFYRNFGQIWPRMREMLSDHEARREKGSANETK